ncbi:MAG: reactive intermediate/imine deaminase [Anaerolineaceae bacterium]|nr:reactive intermediate/imine deaminase [Anaerolineaceae bacterium]
MKKAIVTDKAPKAIGPYSAGIETENMIFTSGQLGIDPEAGKLVTGGIEAETKQALINLKAVLEAGGSNLSLVVKTTVFLRDISEFAKMNSIYAEFFNQIPPARSAFQVAALPLGAAVEIEAVALKNN